MPDSSNFKEKIQKAAKILGIPAEGLSAILSDELKAKEEEDTLNAAAGDTGMNEQNKSVENPVVEKEVEEAKEKEEQSIIKPKANARTQICPICNKKYGAYSVCFRCGSKAEDLSDEVYGFLKYLCKRNKNFLFDRRRIVSLAAKKGIHKLIDLYPDEYEAYKKVD